MREALKSNPLQGTILITDALIGGSGTSLIDTEKLLPEGSEEKEV